MSKPDFEKMAREVIVKQLGYPMSGLARQSIVYAAIRSAYSDGLESAAEICQSRYMGDNTKVDMEARRCAEAIRREIEK